MSNGHIPKGLPQNLPQWAVAGISLIALSAVTWFVRAGLANSDDIEANQQAIIRLEMTLTSIAEDIRDIKEAMR